MRADVSKNNHKFTAEALSKSGFSEHALLSFSHPFDLSIQALTLQETGHTLKLRATVVIVSYQQPKLYITIAVQQIPAAVRTASSR